MHNDMEQQITDPVFGELAIEEMEELAAPGFMDGLVADIGFAASIGSAVALT
ncbi:hypothetical protein ACH4GK_16590 [Streptomyces rimosus]|uniref:hypothetical protein n=1 Tax=Streptomyces rimosus TaxID=1927 RepID=UPI000AEBE3F3|nr:hypothetical protein [Streptomyces rimosus]